MSKCKFYLIRSKKSEEMVDGLQQIALGCKNRADAHGFLWIDAESNIQHIQLLFGEIVIEWFLGKGIKCGDKFEEMRRQFKIVDGKMHLLQTVGNVTAKRILVKQ